MAATLFSSTASTNTKFNVAVETGMILKSISTQISPKKTELTDNSGAVVAVAFIDQPTKIKLDGVVNGATTGALAVATTYSLATANNPTASFGYTSGTILVDSISITGGEGEFQKISAELTSYPLTLTADTTF